MIARRAGIDFATIGGLNNARVAATMAELLAASQVCNDKPIR
jgi:hypothetical protein